MEGGPTLIEVDIQMPELRQGKHVHQLGIFVLQFLAHVRELILSKLPVLPLGGFPVIGRHLGY